MMPPVKSPLSPGYPAAPPIKKQRSSQTPPTTTTTIATDDLSGRAYEAIARRRVELQRLEQLRNQQNTQKNDLLQRARDSLQLGAPSRSNLSGEAAVAPPPPFPNPGIGINRVRHSDIFPSVPKTETRGPPPPPPPPLSSGIARRLDYTGTRPKSAPPARPPPPPTAPPPPTMTKEDALPPPRHYTSRPAPVGITPSTAGPPTAGPMPVSATPTTTTNVQTNIDATPEETKQSPSPIVSSIPPLLSEHSQLFKASNHSTSSSASTEVSSNTNHRRDTPPELVLPRGLVAFDVTSPEGTATATSRTLYAGATPFGKDASSTTALPPRSSTSAAAPRGNNTSWPSLNDDDDDDDDTDNDDGRLVPEESQDLRTRRELRRMEQEKHGAYAQVARLEREIQNLQEIASHASDHLVAIVQVAETQGESAAVDYAKAQLGSSNNITVGFLSPLATFMVTPGGRSGGNPLMSPLSMPESPTLRRRVATPFPLKRAVQQDEGIFLPQAVECVQHVYVTDFATFTIRRPYGLALERDLWFAAGELSSKMYEQSADVNKVSTIEVVAEIDADQSLLVVHGEAMVRYQNVDGEWRDLGNANDRDTPLGNVLYIDGDANERDYSLDEIFECADSARYSYTLSVISTADGLRVQASKETPVALMEEMRSDESLLADPPSQKPATNEVSIQTDAVPSAPKAAPSDRSKEEKPQKEAPAALPTDDGSDVMSVFVGMFVSSLSSILYTLFIGLPIRILTTTIVFLAVGVLLSLGWLYLKDDHGAGSMGATYEFLYNRHGIL